MSRKRKSLHCSAARRGRVSRSNRPVRSDLSHVVCVGDESRLFAVIVEETGQGIAFCAGCGAVVELDFRRPVGLQFCGLCGAVAS